jgi:hypothetical protein
MNANQKRFGTRIMTRYESRQLINFIRNYKFAWDTELKDFAEDMIKAIKNLTDAPVCNCELYETCTICISDKS